MPTDAALSAPLGRNRGALLIYLLTLDPRRSVKKKLPRIVRERENGGKLYVMFFVVSPGGYCCPFLFTVPSEQYAVQVVLEERGEDY